MRVWPPRRLIRRQALIALGLVLVVATTPLFVLRGIARVSETLDTVQLASKTTGAVADAQRDVLLAQLAVEQLEDGGTSVADLRQQSAFLGRQLQVMAAQDLPGEGEARVRAAQDAHATLLEDIDALAATGATTLPTPASPPPPPPCARTPPPCTTPSSTSTPGSRTPTTASCTRPWTTCGVARASSWPSRSCPSVSPRR